jgi:hypothetical protein
VLFRTAHTTTVPGERSTTFVTSGPYAGTCRGGCSTRIGRTPLRDRILRTSASRKPS